MHVQLADKLLNSAFFVDGEEANGGSQTSHGALTPSQSLLSNGTLSHSEVEGQPAQQHSSSSLQATEPGLRRRRRRRLLIEPDNDCFEDDQPCSSGMQPNAQHRRRRLLTERPSSDHGSCFEDNQPCSSGMQPNAMAQRIPQHQVRRETNQGTYLAI